MSDRTVVCLIGGGVWALMAAFWIMQIAYERAINRKFAWYSHRVNLAKACAAGETSLEFRAMQCTWCGNFHPQDDDDCPERA